MQKYIIENHKIEYFLTRKKVKNLNVRIKNGTEIYVSANKNVPISYIESFLIKKKEFLYKNTNTQKIDISLKETDFFEGKSMYILAKKYILRIINTESVYLKDGEIFAENYMQIIEFYKKILENIFYEVSNQIKFCDYTQKMPKLVIKNVKSIWGSCEPKQNKITLNIKLLSTDLECIKYVIIHEYCHFLVQNHSREFYENIQKQEPNYKKVKNKLKNYVL